MQFIELLGFVGLLELLELLGFVGFIMFTSVWGLRIAAYCLLLTAYSVFRDLQPLTSTVLNAKRLQSNTHCHYFLTFCLMSSNPEGE
jgi:hypothetical protein